MNDRGNNSSNWQSEKTDRQTDRQTQHRVTETVNHVTPIEKLVNSFANVVRWNSSVRHYDK